MSPGTDGYRAAMALTAARLRGDSEGEQAIAGECCDGCRPILDGMLRVAVTAIKGIATHDKISPSDAAEVIDFALFKLSRDGR